MTETETPAANRLDRRKARTRAALVAAARELLASRDPAEVSIQEITDAADVGFGQLLGSLRQVRVEVLQGDEQLLLSPRSLEVVVARSLARTDIRESGLAIEGVLPR